jgi:hypothetical protein
MMNQNWWELLEGIGTAVLVWLALVTGAAYVWVAARALARLLAALSRTLGLVLVLSL